MAHLTEFAILALLLRRALDKHSRNQGRSWNWSVSVAALGLTAFYASTDEFHQLFVPSREASIIDVLIDTTGGALGLALFWVIKRLSGRC
jgi:VanZ family protein